VHIFCHRNLTYLFETEGESNWMGRYFFTGGMMPAYDWLPRCADRLSLEDRWAVNGTHYGKTLEAWLALADRKRQTLIPLLEECYGAGQGKLWLQRWRMFFMACAELFNYGDGEEWFVGHYLFRREE
jgi:cyclopropane-fatty-acyl-phospholipid synthase